MNGIRRLAAIAMVTTGVLHLYVAFIAEPEEYLEEYRWLGALFVIGSIAVFYVGDRLLTRPSPEAWMVGAATAAGMAAGLILSRTVGLFGFHEEVMPWTGYLALVLEGSFLLLWAAAIRKDHRAAFTLSPRLSGVAPRIAEEVAPTPSPVIAAEPQVEVTPGASAPVGGGSPSA
jgi:hypothetical protein